MALNINYHKAPPNLLESVDVFDFGNGLFFVYNDPAWIKSFTTTLPSGATDFKPVLPDGFNTLYPNLWRACSLGMVLSQFVTDHPSLKIDSVVPYSQSESNYWEGYYIFTSPKTG